MFFIFFAVTLLFSCGINTSTIKSNTFNYMVKDSCIIGKIPISQLSHTDSGFDWFNKNYNRYKVKGDLISKLKPLIQSISIDVYLGTWCRDTKRMLPKFIKILEHTGYTINKVNYYALDKQKKGLTTINKKHNIVYVPTLIFYRNGKEINRIVENHVDSIEADMLNILTINTYKNYLAD